MEFISGFLIIIIQILAYLLELNPREIIIIMIFAMTMVTLKLLFDILILSFFVLPDACLWITKKFALVANRISMMCFSGTK